MEYRKLIKFGNSSFIISIPSAWLRKNKLGKGDVVYLEEDGGSRLVLHSSTINKKEEKEFSIDTKGKDVDRVKEELYNAYIEGFDVIKLLGDNINEFSDEIRKVLNNFVAIEVIEQTHDKILAKNFLNINDVKINDVIRRIDILIRGMLRDTIECSGSGECGVVVERDVDVNRLCFMLERILRGAMDDPEVAKKIEIVGTDLLQVWYIVMNLESIGDEIKRIARFLEKIDFNKKQEREFKLLFSDIEKSYLDLMKAYYKKNKELAFDVSFRKDNLHERCNKFFEKNYIPMVGGMTEKMKALVSWIKTIAMFAGASRFR